MANKTGVIVGITALIAGIILISVCGFMYYNKRQAGAEEAGTPSGPKGPVHTGPGPVIP